MKIQCARCKEIVALEFELGDGGIDVRCPVCQARYFVAATAAAVGAMAPDRPDGIRCPKCGETQPAAEACRRCGLVVGRWPGVLEAASATEPSLGDAREAAALWAACEEHWDEPGRHDAFLAHCQKTGAFAFAAGRYRGARAQPGREAVCAARLTQIRTLAEFSLARPPRLPAAAEAPTPFRASVVLLVAAIASVVALLVYLVVAPPRRPARPAHRTPAVDAAGRR